jgi:hypothetical protein
VHELRPVERFEVQQQVELAAVVAPMVYPTERHDAVGVVAAAQRARYQVGRVDRTATADEAAQACNLGPLRSDAGLKGRRRSGLRRSSRAERRRLVRRLGGLVRRSGALRRRTPGPGEFHQGA